MRAWMPASRRGVPRGRRRWTTRTPREPLQLRFPTDRTGAETPLSEKTASGSRPRACRERAGRRCRVERPDHEKRDRRSHPEARRGESTTRRLRSSQRGRLPPRQPPSSPIWRSGCQGVGVDGHRLVGCVVDGCGWRGGLGVLGFATVVMLICGGCPKTFVRRTSAVYCRARPPREGGGCSGDESRSWCARAGPPRAASPAATEVSNGRC